MSYLQRTGAGLVVARSWTDAERAALAQLLLAGHTITESALKMGIQGLGFIAGPDAVREVARNGGVYPFLQRYAEDLTREKVVQMHRLFHAHRSDGARDRTSKGHRLLSGLQSLSVRAIYDNELDHRYQRLLTIIVDASIPNTVPYVFVIRGATCSEYDNLAHATGDPIPTISLRFELPKRLSRKDLNRERKLYMFLLARFTQELLGVKTPGSDLGAALRSTQARRLKIFVTEVRNEFTVEHVLVAESGMIPEFRALPK